MSSKPTQIENLSKIQSIASKEWEIVENPDFPFTNYDYLNALETSGTVGKDTGWTPHYLVLKKEGRLEGLSYLYTKDNSYGEYIFDWAWVNAYEKNGIPYFPKLLASVPFTPATGPKLLIAPGVDRERAGLQLIQTAKELLERLGHSSLHYLFITQEEVSLFEKSGFLIRHSYQYHWKNLDYTSFEDFLNTLKPRKRKQIVRERLQLLKENLTFKTITGDDLKEEHAVIFFHFYLSTIEKMGAIPYLNLAFFKSVFETMKNEVILILAERKGLPIAGALYYQKGTNLYGRYWGATEEIRNLHFELCYYLPIEWAIEKKLKLFEAGAQGEHKLSRGFLPELNYSAHWIQHPQFRDAIKNFIEEEKLAIKKFFEETTSHHPYGC